MQVSSPLTFYLSSKNTLVSTFIFKHSQSMSKITVNLEAGTMSALRTPSFYSPYGNMAALHMVRFLDYIHNWQESSNVRSARHKASTHTGQHMM